MIRTLTRINVVPGSIPVTLINEGFDLRFATWGGAVETLQIDMVANGWMGLFQAMLEPSPSTELRWLGSGPGVNAEIKRAYSALFGRFFGRGALRCYHNVVGLRQVEDGMVLAPGIRLRRRTGPGFAGDLPDWVGWDQVNSCFVVAEAKGSHSQGNWMSGNPGPIKTALEQLDRVEIVDASGSIKFKSWAVASRWGTTVNCKDPMLVTYDPDRDERELTEPERRSVSSATRSLWIASLLDGLTRVDLAEQIRRGNQIDQGAFERYITSVDGLTGYGALAIEGGGIFPLVGRNLRDRARSLVETAQVLGRTVAAVVLDKNEAQLALERKGKFSQTVQIGDGAQPAGTVTIDGLGITSSVAGMEFD